nr:hypothetical protein [uncultured Pseudomonas sp.]
MLKFSIVTVALILTAGCATSPVPPNEADPVPADSLYGMQRPTSPNDARIVFTRDSGASCMLYDLHLQIDGRKVASVGTSETATFYHRPGPVMLGIQSNSMCGGGGLQELALDLKPGHSYQVRGYRGMMGDPGLSLSGRPPYPYKSGVK